MEAAALRHARRRLGWTESLSFPSSGDSTKAQAGQVPWIWRTLASDWGVNVTCTLMTRLASLSPGATPGAYSEPLGSGSETRRPLSRASQGVAVALATTRFSAVT